MPDTCIPQAGPTERDRLRADARCAIAAGRLDAADDACRALLELAPDDPEALNFLAGMAMSQGRLAQARDWLRRALAVAPDDGATHTNLGVVLLQSGDPAAAAQALRQALHVNAGDFIARLYLGLALERQRDLRAASAHYFKAISAAQVQGVWTSTATTPAGLQPIVKHAMQVARARRRELLEVVMQPLRERFGREDMARVDRCLAGYLREIDCTPPDPLQKPGFLYFPELPATPFLPRSLFPWYEALEAATPKLLEELRGVLDSPQRLQPFLGEPPPGMHASDLQGDAAPRWDGFFFHRHGRRFDDNCARAPLTAAALEATSIVHIRDHAPEALFSVLGAGSRIAPHHGVTNTRVVTHLPLIVPRDCALRVAGQQHDWQTGRCVSFDDTFRHEAWNNSDRTRVILLFDVWNPYLTEAERAAVTALVSSIGDMDAQMQDATP